MKREWSVCTGWYANQWAIGVTLIHCGWSYVAVVVDIGPFYVEVKYRLVDE